MRIRTYRSITCKLRNYKTDLLKIIPPQFSCAIIGIKGFLKNAGNKFRIILVNSRSPSTGNQIVNTLVLSNLKFQKGSSENLLGLKYLQLFESDCEKLGITPKKLRN